jgi:cytochrome c-type biogenesis protein CcmH
MRLRRIARLALPILLLASRVGGQAAPAPAQETDLDRRTRDVASKLRCPVCQGLSINDSPAELAIEMKGVVKEQLAAGKTPDEVRAYFVTKYGEWVLLEPDPRGFNILVYALPVLGVLGGGLFIWSFVRRSMRPEEAGHGTS